MPERPTLRILSAGAPKAGVGRCVEAFCARTDEKCEIEFATAPRIVTLLEGGASYDVVTAPDATMRVLASKGLVVRSAGALLGAISTGVAIRNGNGSLDTSSQAAFKHALLMADQIIFNRASSGQYIEGLIDRLGLRSRLADKILRTDKGSDVMEALAQSTAKNTLAFGQVTEIKRWKSLDICLAGELPGTFGNSTFYEANLSSKSANPERAGAFLAFLASDAGRTILSDAGLVQKRAGQ